MKKKICIVDSNIIFLKGKQKQKHPKAFQAVFVKTQRTKRTNNKFLIIVPINKKAKDKSFYNTNTSSKIIRIIFRLQRSLPASVTLPMTSWELKWKSVTPSPWVVYARLILAGGVWDQAERERGVQAQPQLHSEILSEQNKSKSKA